MLPRFLRNSTFALLMPLTASAMSFAHIEYNPDGSDHNREWVRILNTSPVPVIVTDLRLFEGGSVHRITALGSSELAPGASAIIAADAATFLSEHPNSTEVVFDSTFSLSNSGELLELRDRSGATVAQIRYQGMKPKSGGNEKALLLAAVATEGQGPLQGPSLSFLWAGLLAALSACVFLVLRSVPNRTGSEYEIVEDIPQ